MRFRRILAGIAFLLSVCGCDLQNVETSPTQQDSVQTTTSDFTSQDISEQTEVFSNECFIELGNSVSINGSGAWFENNCVTISESGIYTFTGSLSDGMIYVNTDETVKLVLDNAKITNKSGPAVFAECGKLFIVATDGTENFITDGKEYTFAREFENEDTLRSAIHSEGSIFFKDGTGKISINARYKDAVHGQSVSVYDCTLSVEADKAGITADSSLTTVDCNIDIISEGDCIKTENEGAVTLQNSNITLETEKDGIQSAGWVKTTGGNITITTSGDIVADAELSSKGIKAANMRISDSVITVNSTDHAIKCDGETEITGGKLTLSSSQGKGITSEKDLTINADIDITGSSEGIESKGVLSINGGNINVVSTDDGLNTGGDDPTQDHTMNINGGIVTVNAGGDGLDANGDINVAGGTVVVFGPDTDANSSLDSGDFGFGINVTGGRVLALGSMGMMKQPKGECVSSREFSASQGTVISVKDSSGTELVSVTAPKAVSGLIYCGENAESCKIYADGKEISVSAGFSGGFGGMGGERGGFGGRGGRKPDAAGQLPDGNMTPPEIPDGGLGGRVPPSDNQT
ncbi:MAG: carbohydrate-binding domain-containing protein [Ruminiclostridium sp.]|nr:carbohydrate-binding domain-containing protein [Ruminiclostridium sp.]